MSLPRSTSICLVAATAAVAHASPPTPRHFDPPGVTAWKPDGCRLVPTTNPIIPSRDRWRMLHGDVVNSNEVSIAMAPVFEAGWHAEPSTFNVTVPVFDERGDLYVAPFLPHEGVVLIALDHRDGSRRWAIEGTGAPSGGVSPMVLADPARPGEEIVYVTLYDRALAVRTDGRIVWDVPTGLALTGELRNDAVTGINYHPQLDAIAGLSADGHLYLLDRKTGAPRAAPFLLPGARSPAGAGPTLPRLLLAAIQAELSPLVDFPTPDTFAQLMDAILGNGVKVSNSFAIDPHTGRMFVAATAPDGDDGKVDGVSERGAIYGLDVVATPSGPAITIACTHTFAGGSASTPTLGLDGRRVYLGDNDGRMLALDRDCRDVWQLDLGAQITGSIAVAADDGELYASTQADIVKVVERGDTASVAWHANLDVFHRNGPFQQQFNMLLAGVSATGVNFMAGAGPVLGRYQLPLATGYGVLDRKTGAVRYFAGGLDESVAEMNVGPDGAYYNADSPVRRAIARVLLPWLSPPIEGGIRQFRPRRRDLLIRDAVCAAADRAENAARQVGVCPASVAADVTQIRELVAQALRTVPEALFAGELSLVAAGDLGARLLDDDGELVVTPTALRAACRAHGGW